MHLVEAKFGLGAEPRANEQLQHFSNRFFVSNFTRLLLGQIRRGCFKLTSLDWEVPIRVATLHESSCASRHKADNSLSA